MKFQTLAVVTLLAMTGCSTVNEYYPGSQVIVINAKEFMVKQTATNGRSSWMATPNAPSVASFVPSPAVYIENLKAIEKASGCPAIAKTVRNTFETTYAEVDCPL